MVGLVRRLPVTAFCPAVILNLFLEFDAARMHDNLKILNELNAVIHAVAAFKRRLGLEAKLPKLRYGFRLRAVADNALPAVALFNNRLCNFLVCRSGAVPLIENIDFLLCVIDQLTDKSVRVRKTEVQIERSFHAGLCPQRVNVEILIHDIRVD